MKKQFIVGMLIMTAAISFNAHAGGATAVKSPREVISEQMRKNDEFREQVRLGNVPKSALETSKAIKDQEKIMEDLGMSRTEMNIIKAHISSGKAEKVDVVNTLNLLLTAKNTVKGKTDAESKSISEYVDAAVKMLSSLDLIGDKKDKDINNLSKDEIKDTKEALANLILILQRPLNYETADRNMFTAVLKTTVEKGPMLETINEALIVAVQTNVKDSAGKPITREKAMDIIRKMKICKP